MERTGLSLFLFTVVVAALSVAASSSAENAGIDQYPDYVTNEQAELVMAEPAVHAPKTKAGTGDATVKARLRKAAIAVTVAKQLLAADQKKADALISKAEASGKQKDQQAADTAVHQAEELQVTLTVAEKKLRTAEEKMARLPISKKATDQEKADKTKVKTERATKVTAAEHQQKAYAKQYGVKSKCKKQCKNEKQCNDKRCTPKFKEICLTYGPKKCFRSRQCVRHVKKCAAVPTCIKHGDEECQYPRTCLKEGTVCTEEKVCEKHGTNCKANFPPSCVECAKTTESCQEARHAAETCMPHCKQQCGGNDEQCITKCSAGCKLQYEGHLAACKQTCPSCDVKSACDCERWGQKKVCKQKCQKWKVAAKKTCQKKCLKMGSKEECNDTFCAEYTVGSKVCSSQCLEHGKAPAGQECKCHGYTKMRESTCKESCTHTKCKPACKPSFHMKCARRAALRCHHPRTCAVPTVKRCEQKVHCARYGEKQCKPKEECTAYETRCAPQTTCAEHETTCVEEFSQPCITCAAQTQSCIAARKSGETCTSQCQGSCGAGEDASRCLERCRSGCSTIQRGLLASCKQECPTCTKKHKVCQKTCKRTALVNKCQKVCTARRLLPEKVCFKPCQAYGRFSNCDPKFCSKYTYGERVCDKPCARYESFSTKWCEPHCEAVQCQKLCTHKPKRRCVQSKQECSNSKCAQRGEKCQKIEECVVKGKKTCSHPSRCIAHKQKCETTSVCAKHKTVCRKDTRECAACKSQAPACGNLTDGSCAKSCAEKCNGDKECIAHCEAGCQSINQGFTQACKAACPVCSEAKQVCTEVCVEHKPLRRCKRVCAKHFFLSAKQCTRGKCLAMGTTKKCDPQACLRREPSVRSCKSKCVRYTTELEKVCVKDCSKSPAASYEEYMQLTTAAQEREAHIAGCEKQCYAAKTSCWAGKLDSCTQAHHADMLKCVASCRDPATLPRDGYTLCMGQCETFHPLASIMACVKDTCGAVVGAAQQRCKQQCYDGRGRCRCACAADREYVCKGDHCTCRASAAAAPADTARSAAEAVAGAAADTADAITARPPSDNQDEGVGAQSAAAAAAREAAKYGMPGERAHAGPGAASKEEELAIKSASRQREHLERVMAEGATEAALSVAQNTTDREPAVQRSEVMLAASAGAKEKSADMVKKVVKLAAVAASKAAEAKAGVDNPGQHSSVSDAAKAAVQQVMLPIMALVKRVAKQATADAVQRYPSQGGLKLSPKARSDLHKLASTAAKKEVGKRAEKENKEQLMKDAEEAAQKASQPKVLSYVKELAAKAATRSRARQLAQGIKMEDATAQARTAAGEVAKDALATSKLLVRKAAKQAVEDHLVKSSANRLNGKKATVHSIAKGVKDALNDSEGTSESEKAKAAKRAIMKEVHRASNTARKEAAEKGKTKESQTAAANTAARNAMKKGRTVQKVVNGITKTHHADTPTVKVKVAQQKHAPLRNTTKTGDLVLEAIEEQQSLQQDTPPKLSHLEVRLREASISAATTAAGKVATEGKEAARVAARTAAKKAAKTAVLTEVRKAAMNAATKAKDKLKSLDQQAQADAASTAASEAAKHVLGIAKQIMDRVAIDAAGQALKKLSNEKKSKAAKSKQEAVLMQQYEEEDAELAMRMAITNDVAP